MITRHQQGFTVVHPTPAFPSPVTPDGTGILGLSPELHTQPGRTRQRMSGRGRAWTLPGLRPWHQPASFDALTHHVRPHVAAINHHVTGATIAPADLGKAGCSWPAPRHRSATVTLNTYSHLWPTAEDRTRKAAAAMMAERSALRTLRGPGSGSKPVTSRNARIYMFFIR